MQLNLADAALFIRVSELGTLSAAARERNEPVSQISRAIARIESVLGVRLLHRSTHGLSLTDEGDAFLAHARSMLDIVTELESELGGKLATPRGRVRLSVSHVLAQTVIIPSLPGLYERYPELKLDIVADDRVSDLARDGIDIAIRGGVDSLESLVVRKIGEHGRKLYAAPGYLNKFGTPKTPADLLQHRLIANSASQSLNRWPFRKSSLDALLNVRKGGAAWPEKPNTQRAEKRNHSEILLVKGHTRVDSTAMVLSLTLAGIGIARLNELLVSPLVSSGQLHEILAEYLENEPIPIYAAMLQGRHRLPKVRACLDYWQEAFTGLRGNQHSDSPDKITNS
jgi:DNA-binding transcriptional LysR family regulator